MTGSLGSRPRRPRLGRPASWAIGLALLVGLAPGAFAQEISDEARQHFRAGVNNLQDPDGERVEEAYVEFKRAYEISKSPKILGNIGYCAMRLERDGEALDAYTRYLSAAPDIKPEEREQIERDLQTLTASAVRLTITSDAKEATVVDSRYPARGAAITNRYALRDGKAEFIVRAGHHVVRLQTDGADRGQWQFDALGGTAQSKNFTVATPANDAGTTKGGGSTSIGPWLLVGVGGAALIGGGVTGVLALQGVKDLEDRCPNEVCPTDSDYKSRKSSTKTLALTTDVLLIGGGVAVVAGASWLIFGSKKAAKTATSGNLTGGALCTPGGCAATFGGRFLGLVERGPTMQRTPWLARALAATLVAAATGCTAVTDVDRFQGQLEDPNRYASMRFTVVGMTSHVNKYFELRLIDKTNKTQFVAVAKPFGDEPQETFNIPHVAFKNQLDVSRLDFFGDMNGNEIYNDAYVDEQNVEQKEDHSWRVQPLGRKNPNPNVKHVGGGDSQLEVRYTHVSTFDYLLRSTPLVPAEQGSDAIITLTGLDDFQGKLLQLRLDIPDRDSPHTVGLFRTARVAEATLVAKMPDIIYEPQPYEVFVYVDANGNGAYDNPAEGKGDLSWRFTLDAPMGELTSTFDLREEAPANIDVGPP